MSRRYAFASPLILGLLWLGMMCLGGPGSPTDSVILGLFHAPWLVPAARALTRLGNWSVLLPITLVAALLLAWRVSHRSALFYLIAVLGGRGLVELTKVEVARDRPPPAGRLVEATTLAFPSGHAAYSMIAWLGLALFGVSSPRLRAPAVALGVSLAFLVGMTRLVLAVHWPSDVIGGWAFGAGWTLLLARLADGTRANGP